MFIKSILIAITCLLQAPPLVCPPGTYTVTTPGPTTVTQTANSITFTWDQQPSPFPQPIPPTPTPIPPTPPAPIPVPGLRVMILYESSQLSMYPNAQWSILYNKDLRTYLSSVCTPGPDKKTPEFRVWDQNVDVSNEPQLWRDVMARPHPSLPWLVVSNGTTGYEGPLPANTKDTMALISKYEVKQ